MSGRGVTLTRAIEVFARGFCFTRSFTHPYLPIRVGPFWRLVDAPRKRDEYRNEEWLARGQTPGHINAVVRRHARKLFSVSVFLKPGESDESLREGFKALGYRYYLSEPLMVHDLRAIPRDDRSLPVTIDRVTTQGMADRLAKAARSRQILPEHLKKDSALRQYVALRAGRPVGWVRGIRIGRESWVSNMYVDRSWRRRGIGRAMLRRLLRDDRATGARAAVLSASQAGAKLYESVGYREIGRLLLFVPRRS